MANVAGVKINPNHVEQLLDKIGGFNLTMIVDLANNRPMKVEGILGILCELLEN